MHQVEKKIPSELPSPSTVPRVRHGTGFARALALFACLAGASLGVAQEAALGNSTSSAGINYDAERNRLSVSVFDQPIVAVFEEISNQAGVGLIVHGTEHGLISADFSDLPLETGMKRLLSGRNHVIYQGAKGTGQIVVWILSSSAVAAGTPEDRSRLATDRRANRSVQRGADAPLGVEKAAQRELRDQDLDGGAENTIRLLPDEFSAENDIIRDAILQGQIPTEIIEALEEESRQ